MKISVVIPAYNEAAVIEKCLQSIISQTRPADEIIVVDNNSTDNTAEIASRYARVVKETKQGIGPTRTRGFDEATGDLIVRIDADTLAAPDLLAVYERAFLEDKDLIAATGKPLTQFAMRRDPLRYFGHMPALLASIDRKYVRKSVALMGFNCAIRKSAWVENRAAIVARDHVRTEDTEVSFVMNKAGKTKYIKEAIAYFQFDDMSPLKVAKYLYSDFQSILYHRKN